MCVEVGPIALVYETHVCVSVCVCVIMSCVCLVFRYKLGVCFCPVL